MDKYEFNFLKFRTELIDLLKRYRYDLSGTGYDDGTIEIYDNRSGKNYVMSDDMNNYQIYDEDLQKEIENYILHFFENNTEDRITNSKIGIFTNDYNKAINFFTNLHHEKRQEIDFYRNSKDIQEIRLLDGKTQYYWIKPNDNSRGHKVEKAYIDRNLTLDELCNIVIPICAYCKKENVKVF